MKSILLMNEKEFKNLTFENIFYSVKLADEIKIEVRDESSVSLDYISRVLKKLNVEHMPIIATINYTEANTNTQRAMLVVYYEDYESEKGQKESELFGFDYFTIGSNVPIRFGKFEDLKSSIKNISSIIINKLTK